MKSWEVYLVKGIAESVAHVLRQCGGASLSCVHMTLLPYAGAIAYDGVVVGAPVVIASPDLLTILARRYDNAVLFGTVIESMPDFEKDYKENLKSGSRPAPSKDPKGPSSMGKSTLTFDFSKKELDAQQEIKRIVDAAKADYASGKRTKKVQNEFDETTGKEVSSGHDQLMWVYRRMFYMDGEWNEQGIPFNTVTVLCGTDCLLRMKQLQGLYVSMDEFLSATLKVLKTKGMDPPDMIFVDDKTLLNRVQALLAPTGIVGEYYPPPCVEEVRKHTVIHTPEAKKGSKDLLCCSFCRACPGDTSKLNLCSQCKKCQYCDVLCQKQHWKSGHKQECVKEE